MWDEFDAIVPPPSCVCEKSKSYVDHMQYLRLFAFLMGLNETYGHARCQILMMIHLPSVSKAYAMIMADESQRVTSSMRTGGDMIKVTSLYAGRGNYSRNNRFEGDKNDSSVNTGRDNYNTKKKVNWNLLCEHCKIYGHTKKNCFTLVGYLEDWKFKKGGQGAEPNYNQSRGMNSAKGKCIANNVQVEKCDDESRSDVFGGVNTGSKHEQGAYDFHSIHTNLQAFAARPDYTPSQYKKIMKLLNEEEDAGAVDMANMTGIFDDIVPCSVSNRTGDYVAVMSTNNDTHKRGNKWIVDSGATCHMTSNLGNLDHVNTSDKILGRRAYLPNGQTTLITHSCSCRVLENVLVVPDFKHDLLSVSQLNKQLKYYVCFFPEFCVFQDLSNGEVKGIGKEVDGLYYFSNHFSHDGPDNVGDKVMMTKTGGTNGMVWHNRLGYPFVKVLKQLSLVEKESDVRMSLVSNQFKRQVSRIRSDNGTEFFSKECSVLLSSLGIIHESSCPHTPQQNGVVERKYRHILEVARALRFQGSITIRFWGESVTTAVYLINMMLTEVLQEQSPYQVFHSTMPKLDHLRTMGCLGYATTLVKEDKFSPRANDCVMICYASTQKGYLLYNLSLKKFIASRDVIFKEHVFPFSKLHDKHMPPFVRQVFIDDELLPAVTEVHDLNPVVSDDGHQQPDHDTTIEEVE
ncbi:uncharacterized protein LOC125850410 [Solanum stenotomum]|uniref:uncharacterized protein LOC125850410 n=1 Tax=Solanum stenotomum TaxID=172797 RepID=UPI0020D17704|nr:uncharacterized protein LOC125850410 [Solanum stenotomum]